LPGYNFTYFLLVCSSNKGEPNLNFSVKEQLLSEIQAVANPTVLVQLFELWQLVKKPSTIPPSPIFALAGTLDDAEACAMRELLQAEFQQIEGEW
jgi:hypothetical protein